MNERKHISNRLGITEQYLSMLLSGKRQVSWPLAGRLAELFPGRTMQGWKVATPDDLERTLKQYEKMA